MKLAVAEERVYRAHKEAVRVLYLVMYRCSVDELDVHDFRKDGEAGLP